MLSHSHSERALSNIKGEPPVFQIVSTGSGQGKMPGSILFTTFQVFIYIPKIPPQLSLKYKSNKS